MSVSPVITGGYFIIGIVPKEDFGIGIEWKTNKSALSFEYNEGDETGVEIIEIQNNGYLQILASIEVQNAEETTEVIPTNGTIEPGKSMILKVITCILNSCKLPTIVITNHHPFYSMCYLPLSISSVKKKMDCTMDDMVYIKAECSGHTREIEFQFKQPKICYGGLSLPMKSSIPCGKYCCNS